MILRLIIIVGGVIFGIIYISNVILPAIFPRYFDKWWMFKKSTPPKPAPVKKFEKAEELVGVAEELYTEAAEEIGDSIKESEQELTKKKDAAKKVKSKVTKLNKLK